MTIILVKEVAYLTQWLKDDERMDRLVRANLDIIQSPSVFPTHWMPFC